MIFKIFKGFNLQIGQERKVFLQKGRFWKIPNFKAPIRKRGFPATQIWGFPKINPLSCLSYNFYFILYIYTSQINLQSLHLIKGRKKMNLVHAERI